LTGAQNSRAAGIRWISEPLAQLGMRCPLLPVAIACVAGVMIDATACSGPIDPRVWAGIWCGLGIGLGLLLSLIRSQTTAAVRWSVVCLFVPTGAAAHRVSDLRYERASILSLLSESARPAIVQGTVDRPSQLRRDSYAHGSHQTSWQTCVELELTAIQLGGAFQPCDGRLSVAIGGRCDQLAPGDSIRIAGSIQGLSPPSNPGAVDLRAIYRQRNLHGRMEVDSIEHVTRLDRRRALFGRVVSELATHGRNQLLAATDDRSGPLALALVVGQRDLVDPETRDMLLVTGTAHLLSVSGLHLAIVVLMARWLAIVLRFPMTGKLVFVLAVCLLYTAITGARPPVLRAAVLVGSLLLASWIRRPVQPLNTLSLAAILLMLLNPELVFSIGVHLSFLAVATLLICAHRQSGRSAASRDAAEREQRLTDLVAAAEPKWIRLSKSTIRYCFQLVWFSGCVSAISLPLVWYHFHVISLTSIGCNLVLTPLLFVSLASGIALIAAGWIWWPLSMVFGWGCHVSLLMIRWVVETAAQIPAGHFWLPSPPGWWVVMFYAVIVCSFLIRRALRASLVRYSWMISWVMLALAIALRPAPLERGTLEATFVNVGHGTSVVVRLSANDVWLYDCGRLGNEHHSSRDIDSTLWSLGITRLRGVFLSHADADHFNALPGLLRRFTVDEMLTAPGMLQEAEPALRSIRSVIQEQRLAVRELSAGMALEPVSLEPGGQRIGILHPPAKRVVGSDNANSLVVRIDAGGRTLLLPGDLEEPGIRDLTNQPRPHGGGVLMAPHHGSLTLDARAVLQWARPREVIVSGGRRASRPEVVDMLGITGSDVHITATSGAIRVRIDASGNIEVRRWRDSPWTGQVLR
jgi:competence protein ComEC